jgi:hypothetical protein
MDEIDYPLPNIPVVINPMYNDTHIALGLVNIHMSIVALK